ncbi:Cys/Met metabolism PLP-dependent enzyme-domain-containing protein [Dactylonectria macrodidyma]|uniref:Sulfhydrylase FUB7 n=1 Tax=Dactylonectria macrodidyma TaxID=307937 RepID=A0A9P9ICC1_9HYPO|nr:Cys/Met metabolism PLP-dependent enzyme-domain-containing protein [Dactylonectria macrodidyma]
MKDEDIAQSGFDTLQLHAGQEIDTSTKSRAVPIYQTVCFDFDSSAHAAKLFAMEEEGYIGTRTGNPTIEVLEKRVAALEGGIASVAVASGQAAVFTTILALTRTGQNIVASANLYHGAYNQFSFLFPEFGVTAKLSADEPESIEAAIDGQTRAVYIETMGHPNFDIPDIEAISKVCRRKGVPLIVENTFGAGGYFCQPIKHGADIVIHSASKWLGGHGTTVGGIIVDGGTFDWSDPKFPNFNQPCPGYHGLNFLERYGKRAFIMRIRGQFLRDVGACISPLNAQQLLLGLETLSLRCERHTKNALELAQWLEQHKSVAWVQYPGLNSHSAYSRAQKYLPRGAGAMLMFGVRGGYDAGEQVVDNFKLIGNMASYGDAKTSALHPASTTHKVMLPEEKIALGVAEEMIRLSVGIESLDDIKRDIQQSLDASPSVPR